MTELLPLSVLLPFIMASVALALAPGPDNIFVLTQSAMSGRRAGVYVTLGLATGLIFHSLAVAFGVAAIFAASPSAFTALKLVGAAYLLYLAWGAFRTGPDDLAGNDAIPAGKLYRRGVVMNITNPKVVIFFLAFLPPFADPARGPVWMQILLLGLVFMIVTLVVFGGVAGFAGTIGRVLRRSDRAQIILNRIAGSVFVLLALTLLLAQK